MKTNYFYTLEQSTALLDLKNQLDAVKFAADTLLDLLSQGYKELDFSSIDSELELAHRRLIECHMIQMGDFNG